MTAAAAALARLGKSRTRSLRFLFDLDLNGRGSNRKTPGGDDGQNREQMIEKSASSVRSAKTGIPGCPATTKRSYRDGGDSGSNRPERR